MNIQTHSLRIGLETMFNLHHWGLWISVHKTCKHLCFPRVWRRRTKSAKKWKWIWRQRWVGQWRVGQWRKFRYRSWLSGLFLEEMMESASIFYNSTLSHEKWSVNTLKASLYTCSNTESIAIYCRLYSLQHNYIYLSSDEKIRYVFIFTFRGKSPASITTRVAVGMVGGALTCTSASMLWQEAVATGPSVSWTTPEVEDSHLVQATGLRTDQRLVVRKRKREEV